MTAAKNKFGDGLAFFPMRLFRDNNIAGNSGTDVDSTTVLSNLALAAFVPNRSETRDNVVDNVLRFAPLSEAGNSSITSPSSTEFVTSSLFYNDSYNGTTEQYLNFTVLPPDLSSGRAWWAIILLIFPLLTMFGNTLVVLSVYKERSLQSVTNYFIVSLAVADIMVAVLVMPFAVYNEVSIFYIYIYSSFAAAPITSLSDCKTKNKKVFS